MDTNTITRSADNIRSLIVAMVEKAKSGHPGGSMGGADFIATLFANHIVYDPRNPMWIARDRFFLDPGHMSPMLYAVLALTGRYSIEELKELRQWGSPTPGHPEVDPIRGIENTSGPLGQGHVMAVGAAIAERFLVEKFGKTLEHRTYAFISDGGIQEEISQGAGRIAGHLGLSNLIMFYDSNDVQLSTKVHQVTDEDTATKYRAWGWNVLEVEGNDVEALDAALTVAEAEKQRPTLIIGHTIMAKGAVKADGSSLEGAVSTHGQPLSKAGADVAATLRGLGADPENPFQISEQVQQAFDARKQELVNITDSRHAEEDMWAAEHPDLAATLQDWIEEKMPDIDWDKIEIKPNSASRSASATILGELARCVGNMIVSSADLCNSDKTDGYLKQTREITASDFGGKFLQSGVAELTMAAICNGICLHGAMRAACGTFFVFSDYIKPALRMSALMEQPVKYIFTHDAFRVGEDGPTHEPIEHEAQMRLLEQMDNHHGRMSTLVMRPADSAETVVCWKMAMENNATPSVLILSRQDLEDLPGADRRKVAYGAEKGGYLVRRVDNPALTIIANGSEVSLALKAADIIASKGIQANVASIPSVGLFMRQSAEYRNSVLPDGGHFYGVTAGLPSVFMPLMKRASYWDIFGMERFGASAPFKVLDEKFGFTPEHVAGLIETFMK